MRIFFFCAMPFICCIMGYVAMSYVMDVAHVTTPNLVGLLLPQALSKLSEMQLYGHIISEKEDPDIAPGTILEQMPRAGYRMKLRQSVGLIIIKKPAELLAFNAIGKPINELSHNAEVLGIRAKIHKVGIEGVENICCAQYPGPQRELADHAMQIYIPQPRTMICIMPDFRGMPLVELEHMLVSHGFTLKVLHETTPYNTDHMCHDCIVKDHKPAPGELINKDATRVVHVYVFEKS